MAYIEIFINTFAGFVLFVYWGVAFIILYHLTRFGIGVQPKRLAAIFILGSVVLTSIAVIFFVSLDITTLLPQ